MALRQYFTWCMDDTKRPVLLSIRSSNWFILGTICFAVFTDIFLYALIVPVVPFALEQRAHVDADQVQYWVSVLIAVYGAALLVGSPICGWFADHSSSRRFPLLCGLVTLAGATVMLNVAANTALFVVGRILQGISAAVVWVVGLALLADTVGGDERIGEAMGWVGLAMSMGMLLAPILGGIVFDRAGYNAVFAMAYALIGFDIVLRLVMVEKKIAKKWFVGSEMEGALDRHRNGEVSPQCYSATEEKDAEKAAAFQPFDVSSPDTPSTMIASPATPTVPARALHTKRNKLPPVLSLLASRRLLSSLWCTVVQGSLLTSFDAVLPLFVKQTFGWSSLGAGLLFLPIVIPAFVGPAIGYLCDRYSPRWPAALGFIIACPFYVLLRLVDHDSINQKVLICALLALIGLSLTLCLTPLMAEITYVVQEKERKRPGLFGKAGAYAQAYGLFNMAFACGCLVGPLWAGFINETAGWSTMTWTLGLLAGFTSVPALLWVGGSIFKLRNRRRDERASRSSEETSGS